ncbi:stress-activated map kinase-interacting protein 1 [Condylostylus longicornis]|uniref:stress-activated map kinase-interacting protein 1 n=1 Tax=Condylostylus longicornis TaxID=2530218 RepID=UPI00244E5690|nr:stress-activated map kinase-interacting protein 1 [Condylostylus longicornis]
MATYNNQHWLLCHIRNSFISTDDTEVCETVMTSDDLPKHFLSKNSNNTCLCYPGLDQSDDEDLDAAAQSYEIHMCPDDVGVHRFRSNTTQKLDRMNRARQKAAKTKNIKIDDSAVLQSNDPASLKISDFFQRKEVASSSDSRKTVKSLLSEQILHGPKLPQNKFIQYARFDGESQAGVAHLNIFLNIISEPQLTVPMKICVIAQAKIEEVIGFICYKLTVKYPEIQLQSIRHYGLYITEDNGEMLSEFPPLDMKALCQKYEFQYLTLAERRPTNTTNRVDYRSFSLNSDTDTARERALDEAKDSNDNLAQDMERMLGHNLMIEAPVYSSYHLNIVGKGFFKSEVQLGISGERLEIYPVSSNNKFWSKQKAISHNIESIGFCEILTKKTNKAVLRIWYLNPFPQSSSFHFGESGSILKGHPFGQLGFSNVTGVTGGTNTSLTSSSSSPQHFNPNIPSISSSSSFKYYDFETDQITAQQILNKMNFILEVRSTATRKEFLAYREKRKERLAKKPSRK